MSLTTAFISELVWAANQAEHLTNFEKRRLLERAVITIREMRDSVTEDVVMSASPPRRILDDVHFKSATLPGRQ